ncbi:MAG: cryptochrome/photolyase family protein [Flavobacteriia bacterium]|nr:cryptochrome/photolyase family protein [Flavobacteriia bacterium]
MPNQKTIRLILGDQLNIQHSWFKEVNNDVIYTLMEVRQETDYTTHHIQKVMGIFASMRSFAEKLEEGGHVVRYFRIGDSSNTQDIPDNIDSLLDEHNVNRFEYMLPDEYRLDILMSKYAETLNEKGIETDVFDTEHFFTQREYLKDFFEGKKTYLMESFYRSLRKKFDILMEGDSPEGDKWNYDHSNRESLPDGHQPIAPLEFNTDLQSIQDEITDAGVKTMGTVQAKYFGWPTTREQSLELLEYFVSNALPWFGKFQDAMTPNSWSIYHSRLSFSMNIKLISPSEVIDKAIAQWRKFKSEIDIAQIEGFVRQILGWREYMRGVYWAHMPEYADKNFFDHDTPLPSWYWDGKTKMACMKHAIKQSLEYAYAHHIQRLMVTGNFALLAGIDPDELDQWYLGIYIDAFEWVEITNTRGMSQFADGGIVGTKPYVSSANYIGKMGSYCDSCYYSKSKKTEDDACPFNSLYWHFYARNRDRLENNHRVGMMYRTWDKMGVDKQNALLERAERILENLDNL